VTQGAIIALTDPRSGECCVSGVQSRRHAVANCSTVWDFSIECIERLWRRINDEAIMTVKERLAELERQHKALDHEIAEALGQTSIDDLKIKELKRRKLMLKDEIERLRHDHAL
jgi:hypothetical protein